LLKKREAGQPLLPGLRAFQLGQSNRGEFPATKGEGLHADD
jgi:hypothetical protein